MIEDHFKKYLEEKRTVRLSDDFDKEMMSIIRKHSEAKSKDKKHIIFMYFFFLVGLLLGFALALSFVDLEFEFDGERFIIYKVILIFPLVMVILFLFDKVYRATLIKLGKGDLLS